MGVFAGPEITESGLVLALDGGNTKSYPGILDNIVGWRLPSTNYIRGTLLDNDRTWSSEPSTGYSSVILNKTFNAGENFEVIAYWARDYRGIGMVYGPNVSIFDFTGYSVDGTGPYFGALNTSGFPSGYSATFFGQYHSPIQGQGAQTTGYWFKWDRTLNTLSLQYSATSSSGPWTNILANVSINSTDKVIIGAGEASSNEVSDLSLISVGPGPYTWTDLSGNGNNGTLVNGVGYSASNGGSLSFDGVDDNIFVANNSSFNVVDNITLEMWIKLETTQSSGLGFLIKYSNGYLFYVTPDAGKKFAFDSRNGDGTYYRTAGTTNIQDGVWKQLTAQKTGLYYRVYVNGVLEGTTIANTVGNISGSVDLRIGTDNTSYLNGKIGSFKIYNRALSAAEVSQNFNALRGRFGI